ncbi:transcriptional regulator [Pseudomonas taeanensis MS-3]|jgi:osmotically inducible lipoprotein OsmE|uniref:Transcriptional regulator n=1 Tax=Pseudomonas taeanensis MS-3 TaxID=1395571 RepID=A0A0A1YR50_9PSED|nr:osmotically-inducible lipoprotein OsmE [Pseudomonas taeanensis]KFX71871.1 transcriptional regulator [Pseudomonas taeanensis MS-3]
MYLRTLSVAGVLTALAGCAGQTQNPIDYLTYRDEPLVQEVALDMNKQHVLEIAGPPSSEEPRTVSPGTCNNYILNKEGRQQAYYVSFNSAGRVDGKGFISCQQMEKNERARARAPVFDRGGGY